MRVNLFPCANLQAYHNPGRSLAFANVGCWHRAEDLAGATASAAFWGYKRHAQRIAVDQHQVRADVAIAAVIEDACRSKRARRLMLNAPA